MSHQPASDDDPITLYRWTCPICDESRLSAADGVQDRAAVLRNLEAHIQGTAGEGHGDEDSFPDEFDPDTLTEYVELETRTTPE